MTAWGRRGVEGERGEGLVKKQWIKSSSFTKMKPCKKRAIAKPPVTRRVVGKHIYIYIYAHIYIYNYIIIYTYIYWLRNKEIKRM